MEKVRKEERDNFTIVLENLQSDFKIFGENLDMVREKVDMNFEEIGNIKIILNEMNGRLDNLEDEVKSIREDFDFVKKELKSKVDKNIIKSIERRLKRVEKHLELVLHKNIKTLEH